MSFFKPSVFIKTFLFFCAICAATLFFSCKQLASFDPGVEGARVAVSNTISAPTGMKATNGLKQKISLTWTPVSGARYYEIYYAESATAEFKKVGETEKSSFDDKVGAGKTYYYKVCAVKSNGTQSPFSITTKGTSLAKPVISGGDVNDSSATITWFMENAQKNYDDLLCFEIFCGEKSQILNASSFTDGAYECTFENLAGSTDYQIYVRAYLSTDQQSYEESAKVNKTTLTSYMPLAAEFNVSEGESAKGIWLHIKLPEMVMVNTVTKASPNEEMDEKYPLCFKIYRRSAEGGGDYGDEICKLYYNGSTEPPTAADYQDTEKRYNAGDTITWFDEGADLQGGVKYEYMVRSVVDINYGKVGCSEGKEYEHELGTDPEKANKDIGWKSAHPSFKLDYSEDRYRTFSADNTKVLSYEFGFTAKWDDLGKADKYKFAIKQNCLDNGTDTWLEKGGSIFFDTIGEVNSHLVKFGSASGLSDDEKGVYAYTLYIVPKGETGIDESKVLDSVAALDTIQVTPDVNLPEAVLDVKGGYKDKVVLKISSLKNNEADVTYKIARTKWKGENQEGYDEFELNIPSDKISEGTYEYNDESLQGNCRYSYVLTATSASGAWAKSQAKEAETLGTPKVEFKLKIVDEKEELPYDSVTVSFDGVLAAKEYTVTLGAANDFGGGIPYTFVAGGDSSSGNAEVSLKGRTYSVTINKPEGYDNAKLAGKTANLTVTAKSGVDNASDETKVNVLGPALLNAQVNTFAEADETSISLTWNKVDGAKGYLIRRVMYDDAAMTKIAEDSEVTYYCDASGNDIMAEGEKVYDKRAEVVFNETNRKFTLTDTYKENELPDDDINQPDRARYQKAQAKIFWGLPFRYVVLPVLNEKDFDFEGLKLAGGEVAYTNLKPTDGTAALGYGMEVHAEKSKNTEEQVITWVEPFHASKTAPRVFRRLIENGKTEGNFLVVEASAGLDKGDNSFTYVPQGDDKYNAYEYIVQYGVVSVPTLNQDLLKDFEGRKDAESPTEQANKGYLFTVEDFNLKTSKLAAVQGGSNTYAERVTWDTNMKPWEYKNRALGPTGVKLYIMNNNIDGEWHPVATIGSMDYSGNVASLGKDVSAEKGSDGISLYPTSIAEGSSGTTSGMFKVLRDYKHYYALTLTRGDLETQKYTPGFGDYSSDKAVYAYRDVTAKELLILSMDTIRSSFKKKWYTEGDWSGNLKSTSFGGTVTGTCYTGIDRNGFAGTNYRRYQRFVDDYMDSFIKVNGTMMKDNGGGVSSNQYQGTWLHYGSSWPSDNNFKPQTDCLTVSIDYLSEERQGKLKLDNIKIDNNDANAPNWKSGTFEVTYNGKTETFDNTQIPFGFLMNDETFYNKVEEMCY